MDKCPLLAASALTPCLHRNGNQAKHAPGLRRFVTKRGREGRKRGTEVKGEKEEGREGEGGREEGGGGTGVREKGGKEEEKEKRKERKEKAEEWKRGRKKWK